MIYLVKLDSVYLLGQFDMRLESGRKEEDAIVWALEALADGTVVSGDSYGRLQVSTVYKCRLTMQHISDGSPRNALV